MTVPNLHKGLLDKGKTIDSVSYAVIAVLVKGAVEGSVKRHFALPLAVYL